MHSRTWKRAESLAAQIIGGRRVFQKFSAGDAESEAFVADAKKRLAYSQRQMRDDLDKLQASPETGSRTAVLVLIDTPGRGHRARAPLVVMTAEAFQAWHRSDTIASVEPAAATRPSKPVDLGGGGSQTSANDSPGPFAFTERRPG